MADSKRSTIHLVPIPFPKPQHSADPKDIAAEVLKVVRECKQGLFGYRADAEVLVNQMGGLLDALEAAAVRAIRRKR
jgi:hypothetical protein